MLKKFLSIIGVVGITTLSTTSVVACGVDPLVKINEKKDDLDLVVNQEKLIDVQTNLKFFKDVVNPSEWRITNIQMFQTDPHYPLWPNVDSNIVFTNTLPDGPKIILKARGVFNLTVWGIQITSNNKELTNGSDGKGIVELMGWMHVNVGDNPKNQN